MRRSTNRILVSHAGTTPRPANLPLAAGVAEVVKRQVEVGIDVVNDGELSKSNFTNYVRDRLGGIAPAESAASELPPRNINARDLREFPEFFATGGGGFGRNRPGTPGIPSAFLQRMVVTGPITYIGEQTVRTDIANMQAAIEGLDVEPFLPAVAPGTVEHWLYNQHYATDEAFLFALADALHAEYKAITDAGLNLQIDDPDLPDGWQMFPEMSVAEYQRYATLRV